MNKIELTKGQKIKAKLSLLYGNTWKERWFKGIYISCWKNKTDNCWMYDVDLGGERGKCTVTNILPIGKIIKGEIALNGHKYVLE